jgi:xanthosine utilization system XapX-like protein
MDWNDLQAEFRSGGEPIAPGELHRFRRRERLKMAFEVAAGAAVVAFYAVALLRRPAPPLVALAIVSVLVVGGFLTYLFTTRHALLTASATDAAQWKALLRDKLDADVRANRLLGRFCIGGAVFGLLWGPWQYFAHEETYRAEPWRAVVGFGVYYAILAGLWLHHRRTKRRLGEKRAALTP